MTSFYANEEERKGQEQIGGGNEQQGERERDNCSITGSEKG